MKSLLKIMAVAGLAFTLVSCAATNDPYGNNYPTNYPNNGPVFRAPDGTVYRQGDVYRDRSGNVYQNGRVIRTGDVYGQPGILGRNGSNTVYYPNNNARNLPPGQAKKIYGGKATDYAPGQVKKRNGNWENDKKWRKENDKRYKAYQKNNKKYDKRYENHQGDQD
ncbi:hypothetical protein MTP09_03885 [Chryseobacterium suipulveris]|uniref:Lipoprotein n=1 Tax=Chryseobacterium suipulveris TaxID=2929800 RepID=A0ABY4BS94_9FLAO|nr:hypothetical protein [Chryseobacterium suipulveris]UOE41784.1 hypothetical protein MTP09_03885 [Chryseobacterium suipulveris]